MVMLSRFLRHKVTDTRDQRVELVDFVIDLSAGDYPPVVRLVFHGPDHHLAELPWDAVHVADWAGGRLTVADLSAAVPVSSDTLEQAVLLKRDVLDALVLDLENRQAVRANDLWLYEDSGSLLLRAVDIGAWAVLRRLGQGLLGRGVDRNLVDWKHVEFLRGDPQAARAGRDYHRRVAARPPAEIARLIDAIPYLHAAELLTLIPDPIAADVLEAMTPERQVQVFEELDEDQALRLLVLMAPDAAADLLGRLAPQLAERHLNAMPHVQRERVVELLRYPDDSVGGIMTNDVILVPGQLTVGAARAVLREQLMGPDFVYYVYIVDDEPTRNLLGVLTLRDFLVADETRRLEEVMNAAILTVDPLAPAQVAARQPAGSWAHRS